MKFQLALQFPSDSSVEDLDRLISIEEIIRKGLGKLGIVDGHDIGSGEMNVFIHTNEPKLAFERSLKLLSDRQDVCNLTAGYRDFDEDEYKPIYPKGLKRFSVI